MSIEYYKANSLQLADQYLSLDPGVIHQSWLDLIPRQAGLACDIGAGSGRDANWLAAGGWSVTAVEPCNELRELGRARSHHNVNWIDDRLPDLDKLRKLDRGFDLILMSAVWMHVPPQKRERAFRILTDLLAPGGILVITLRHGHDQKENKERGFHEVSAGELEAFAKTRALALIKQHRQKDEQSRLHVEWETLVFKLPDDGTGSLPLLRHIIVNDDKSATYKLGLLRSLIRIAEGAPGMVLKRTDDYVEIPFGLVGLYWLKIYMPLVLQYNIIQAPSAKHDEHRGYGWASVDFWSLADISVSDLRIGAVFRDEDAKRLISSINKACENIRIMPVKYTSYPGGNLPVFSCDRHSVRVTNYFEINRDTLSAFGEFRIPVAIWQTMSQYACWLEPAIINEWVQVMHPWNHLYDKNKYHDALKWKESVRETKQVRDRIAEIQARGIGLHCVWTDRRLRENAFHVDHCFPWSRWFNNDLWNLMPASIAANSSKSERLPSAELMRDAKKRIIEWWDEGYINSIYKERFFAEAQSSLPLVEVGTNSIDSVYEAMMHQRARLKANQQLVEWAG